MNEDLAVTEKGAELARELRAEAKRLGIRPETATDQELRPLLSLLPKALVEDAHTMDDDADTTLIGILRIIFDNEAQAAPLN